MNIKKFLFYYCVFAVTGLAVYMALFAPRPEGLLLFVLFIPVPLFFWKRIFKTGAGSHAFSDLEGSGNKLSKKEFRNLFALVLTTSILISASTVVAYSKVGTPQVKSAQTSRTQIESLTDELNETSSQVDLVQMSNEAILREIKDLKRELSDDTTTTKEEDTLPDTKHTEKETMIKISSTTPIDIYEDKSYSSKVIGKSEKSIYPYTKKVDTWYLILLPNGTEGWVSASFVTEL